MLAPRSMLGLSNSIRPISGDSSSHLVESQALMRLARRKRELPPNLAALKEKLRAPQLAQGSVLSLGDPMDACFPSRTGRRGLPLGNLHEIVATALERETCAVSAGFLATLLAALPRGKGIVWIASCPDLYPPGLLSCGLDPGLLVFIRPPNDADVLAAMETVLREGGCEAVVGEVGHFNRIASRRLQLACFRHGITGFVLRRWPHGRNERAADVEATFVASRWQIAAVPSEQNDDREPGFPRWNATLTHARGGHSGAWILETVPTEAADGPPHPFRVVTALAGDAPAPKQRIA